jgi:CDP-diacylglycerol--glycerol-3-phosphate 3-phosphatidyltransferase
MRALGIEAAWRRRGGGGRSLCTSFVQPVQPAVAAEAHSILAGLAAHGLPCFSVPPSAARLLCSPTDFRTALLQGARTARRRVSLSSLYLGDGPLETALVDELVRGQAAAAAATCSAPRQLLCLLDYHRARRPGALLLPAKLSRAPGGRVCLLASPSAPRAPSGAAWGAAWGVGPARAGPALFASEQLAGGLSEVLGVHHMKLALFDDDVVISGANLSHEYLTNRQDRYLLLRGVPALADWLAQLLEQLVYNLFSINKGFRIEQGRGFPNKY